MNIEEAGKLVAAIHQQNGDTDFEHWFSEFKNSFARFDSYDKWSNDVQHRTDISQDQKWELECFSESFVVLFALLTKAT